MELKKEIETQNRTSNLTMENRKKLVLTGVDEVVSFNDREIMLSTSLGEVVIKGEELKMTKLDVQNGDIIVCGKINSFAYSGSKSKTDNESILSKLFK